MTPLIFLVTCVSLIDVQNIFHLQINRGKTVRSFTPLLLSSVYVQQFNPFMPHKFCKYVASLLKEKCCRTTWMKMMLGVVKMYGDHFFCILKSHRPLHARIFVQGHSYMTSHTYGEGGTGKVWWFVTMGEGVSRKCDATANWEKSHTYISTYQYIQENLVVSKTKNRRGVGGV